MFSVGQEVICINDTPDAGIIPTGLDGLTKDCRYTIRECRQLRNGKCSVTLVEIRRKTYGQIMPTLLCAIAGIDPNREIGYKATRFAIARKTDISLLTDILAKANNGILEPI